MLGKIPALSGSFAALLSRKKSGAHLMIPVTYVPSPFHHLNLLNIGDEISSPFSSTERSKSYTFLLVSEAAHHSDRNKSVLKQPNKFQPCFIVFPISTRRQTVQSFRITLWQTLEILQTWFTENIIMGGTQRYKHCHYLGCIPYI